MALDTSQSGSADVIEVTAEAAVASREAWQLRDGRPGANKSGGVSSGNKATFDCAARQIYTKAASVTILAGGRVYWDHSANAATYFRNNDRDYYLGRAFAEAAAADETVEVIPDDWPYDLDLARDPFTTAIVGTQALGGLELLRRGGAHHFVLSATSEAQKVDALSVDAFAVGANAIVEGAFRVISDGAGTVVDVSIGIANATHASDADAITESMFIHLDANDVDINAESDDGTTEVAATDTTVDYTEGAATSNRVEFWFDLSNPANTRLFINGVQRLTGTTFKLDAATGPMKLLVHVEKTASTDTYELAVDFLRARTSQQ